MRDSFQKHEKIVEYFQFFQLSNQLYLQVYNNILVLILENHE